MARSAARRKKKKWVRWWGLLPITVMIIWLGVARPEIGPFAVGTGLVLVWALFSAPVTCGAANRIRAGDDAEFCRNNSAGMLLGCWIREHKWQHFTKAWWSSSWRVKTRGLWAGPSAKLATVSAVVGILTGLFGSGADLIKDILPRIA
ncbi:hypothetical protein [Microlunatus sp. GCM10028923]|uniref:hypothetical protein n=1 Tax=Microlunatus sp. GCM10028923 TaxID=3273400 RepID=UPI00361B02F2